MRTKKAKKRTIKQRADKFKASVKDLHEEALNVSDNLVDASLSTGSKWQKIMAKALKEGTVLFGKQQELVLETLEELKGQYVTGNKRFKKLIGWEPRRTSKASKAKKAKKLEIDDLLETSPKAKAGARKVKAKTAPKAKTKTKVETSAPKSIIEKDDLKIIQGIGPKIESLINEAGITTFDRLATTDVKELKEILENAGPRFKALNPTTWKEQAELAVTGKLEKQS